MYYRLQKSGKYHYVYLMDAKREGKKVRSVIVERLGRYDRLPEDVRALVDKSIAEVKERRPGDASRALVSQKSAALFNGILSGFQTAGQSSFNKFASLRYGHLALLPIWTGELGLRRRISRLQRQYTEITGWEIDDLLFYLCALKVIDPCSYLNARESRSQFLYCPWEGINLDSYYYALDFAHDFGDRMIAHAVKSHLAHTGGQIKMAFFDCTNCYFETPYDDRTWQIIRYTRQRIREKQKEGLTDEEIDIWLESGEFDAELKDQLQADEALILRMRGKSREGRYSQPIVTVALAIDQTGFPIDAGVFAGNISELRTLSVMLDSLQDKYQIKDICFVADKGLNSTENLKEIGERGLGFVVSQPVLNKSEEFTSRMLDPEGYRNFDFDGVNFTVREGDTDSERARFKVSDFEQSSYVPTGDGSLTPKGNPRKHKITVNGKITFIFSPQRRDRDLQDLKSQRARAQLAVENGELMGNPYSTGWRALIKTKKEAARNKNDKEQYRATGIKEDVYNRREKLAGYSAIVFRHPGGTDEKERLDDVQILGTYHKLVAIEDCFRIMKTTFSIRPVNVRLKAHVEGHCYICVLALMLMKSLQQRLAADGGKVLSPSAISMALDSAMVVADPSCEMFLNINPSLKFGLLKDLHKHKTPRPLNDKDDEDRLRDSYRERMDAGPDALDRLLMAVGCTPLPAACTKADLRNNLKLAGYSGETLISPYIERYGRELAKGQS